MRTLILYTSQTGSTQKYAEDIASSIGGDVFPSKKFKWKNLKNYDTVVFGGWVRGGKIQGLDDFLSHYDDMEDKNVLIFSSGMSYTNDQTRKEMISANVLDIYHVRYYQLRGSFDFNKLGTVNKMMFNMGIKQLSADPNQAAVVSMMETVKETPIEYYDDDGINRILTVLHRLVAEPQGESK